VVTEVTNPQKEKEWRLKIVEKESEDKTEIAETFNQFFGEKIQKLKENMAKNIDQTYVKDPLIKLKKKMKGNKATFKLKKVNVNTIQKALKKMNKKKSSGWDGLSQENLILGASNLAAPLMNIVH
jgi:N-acetyl-beta-hexosaminidase